MRKTSRVGVATAGALAALLAGALTYSAASGNASATTMGAPAPITPSAMLQGARSVVNGTATLNTTSTTITDPGFAGYFAAGGTTTFRSVNAHINVPVVDCVGVTATNGAVATAWVGLGFSEALGVAVQCQGTTPAVSAWWAVTTSGGSPSITIHQGDSVNLNVFFNSSTHEFTLTFTDNTDGQSFTRTRTCPSGTTCFRDSTDAVTEAVPDPTKTGGEFLPLADFQAVGFTNVHTTNTSGTHSGGLQSSNWNTFKITEVSSDTSGTPLNYDLTGTGLASGLTLARATPLFNKSTFLVYWSPNNAG